MSLVPRPKFEVRLPKGRVVPGETLRGTLVVTATEAIPRARSLHLTFRSVALATYPNDYPTEKVIFFARVEVPVASAELPAGEHHVPFRVEVPESLIPGFAGMGCEVQHEVRVHMDVDWALDPSAVFVPRVELPPRQALRLPTVVRSPEGFHESVVLEVTLSSRAIVQGEPLAGQVAVRAGLRVINEDVRLSFASVVRVNMGGKDRRRMVRSVIRVPAKALRSGEPVAFQFPADEDMPPTYYSPFIDHEACLVINFPTNGLANFEIPVQVWPRGSSLLGEAGAAPLGSERMFRIASAMAQSSGLRVGQLPVLVKGSNGAVSFRVVDVPRDGRLGVSVEFSFPNTELGLTLRRRSLLELFEESHLLPEALRERHALHHNRDANRPPVPDASLHEFCERLLADTLAADDLQLSDHHQSVHFALPNDEPERMNNVALFAVAHADRIRGAIAALPFPHALADSLPAWRATANEQSATLIPTGPALHGLRVETHVARGGIVAIDAFLRTVWTRQAPSTRMDIHLPDGPLPPHAQKELRAKVPTAQTRGMRAMFPVAHVSDDGKIVSMERPGFATDPRAVLPVLHLFLSWLLTVRGEDPCTGPYR